MKKGGEFAFKMFFFLSQEVGKTYKLEMPNVPNNT